MLFWILAFMGLFNLLKDKMLYYVAIGLVVAIYGCIGGSNFAFEGLYNTVYGISNEQSFQMYNQYPLSFNLTLFWSGPLFPLSIFVLGINLVRSKRVPWWTGILMCLSAFAFPVSRIPRIAVYAHLADVLLQVPMVYIGWCLLTDKIYVGTKLKEAV